MYPEVTARLGLLSNLYLKRSLCRKRKMINYVLIAALVVLCAVIAYKPATVFCLITFLCSVVGYYVPDSQGQLYYIGAAISDLMIALLIGKEAIISRLTLKLQRVCAYFIVLNFFGWSLWMLYLPPTAYNWLSTALYLYTITTIVTQKGISCVGNNKLASWLSGFSSNHCPRLGNQQRNKEELST